MGSEAYLVFVAAFRISAHDLVSLSSRPRYLHPDSAHGAVVGNCLGFLLLLYLLYVLEIAQDSLRSGRGPTDLIGIRIGVLRYLLRPESELNLDSSTFLLSSAANSFPIHAPGVMYPSIALPTGPIPFKSTLTCAHFLFLSISILGVLTDEA